MSSLADQIRELREKSGAGFLKCQQALAASGGQPDKALALLREQGFAVVEKKATRVTAEGIIESYVHPGGRIGVLLEINSETDFAARDEMFKQLAHDMALQVAAMAPQYVSQQDMPKDTDASPEVACLLNQPFIKDTNRTVQEVVNEVITRLQENVRIRRFCRFEIGG
ncbi:MAG: elongation factor Ts [Chloroflexota bacterium]